MGRDKENVIRFAERFDCKACPDIDELMALEPDFTAEAASAQAIRDYSETVSMSGSNLVVLSIGAFADADFYEKVKAMARKCHRRVYIASGAVGGFDVLRTAALMSPVTASISSRTSRIAAWSVVAVLQNAVSPIVF